MSSDQQEGLLKEAQMVKELQGNRGIVRLYHYEETKDGYLDIYMDLYSGDLWDHIKNSKGGKLSYGEAKEFCKQIAENLQLLRKKRIIHKDLKPHNILVDSVNNW